jgi:hypothetical protein
MSEIKLATCAAALEILEGVAKLAVRAQLGAGECVLLFEKAFLRAAERAFMDEDRSTPTQMQLSARTGFTAKKIRQLQAAEEVVLPVEVRRQSRTGRVVFGWHNDPRFCKTRGHPRILALRGKNSFSELARAWGKHERAKPVLDELLFQKMVKLHEENRTIELLSNEPAETMKVEEIVELGRSAGLLMEALTNNMDHPEGGVGQYFRRISNVHMKPQEALVQTRNHVAQVESTADSIALFVEDPKVTVQAANEPRAAECVHVMLCVTHHPVVVPPTGVSSPRKIAQDIKQSVQPGSWRTRTTPK